MKETPKHYSLHPVDQRKNQIAEQNTKADPPQADGLIPPFHR
jgi:hypothetical protein